MVTEPAEGQKSSGNSLEMQIITSTLYSRDGGPAAVFLNKLSRDFDVHSVLVWRLVII